MVASSRRIGHDWLEHAPIPTGVVRRGRFVYVNAALRRLLGRDDLEGSSFLDVIAPEDHDRLGERHTRRMRGERVADTYECDVVRADGERRRVGVTVGSTSDGDVIFHLHDRTPSARREENLHAIARLGAEVQAARDDETILHAVADGLRAVGVQMIRFEPRGSGLEVVGTAFSDTLREKRTQLGETLRHHAGPWARSTEVAWREGASFLDDMPLSMSRFVGGELGERLRALLRDEHLHRGVQVRIDVRGAPSQILLLMGDWFEPQDLPAFRLFAAQVTAAIDAARVIADLSSRNAALAAIDTIAAVASAGNDTETLFDVGATELARVLSCTAIAIYVLDDAEGVGTLVHQHGGRRETGEAYARVPLAGTKLGVVAKEGAPRIWFREEYPDEERREHLRRAGQDLVVSVPLKVRSKVVGVMNVAYSGRRAIAPEEIELMTAAGAHFAAAVETSRLLGDLRRSYAELARAQEQLVERERLAAIGELAAVVAHEVRNPLGVIFNSIGGLRRPLEDEDQRALLDILDEEAKRLNQIVGDLLDFARPTMPSFQRVRIEPVLEQAIAAALPPERDGVRVVRDFDSDLPPAAIDARLLRQAFLNLVQNAVQAMPGGGTLTVRAHREGRRLRVEIGDTGEGIPQEHRARVFEPFFTTRATGTGLGLAVVRRIVAAHRGETSVSSEPGSTVLVVRLPIDHEGG